ncbi:DUF1642 domain-containing protein [Streptococcus parasanguinis]|uniref:DUF1642 domain-containing protein n=1 Tax=Streptococcus parasanguinis TaxID=1318 RepID=UPI00352D4027
MNKDKVYLKGYVIGRAADTLGYHRLMVQLENLDIVEIDKNLVHRDINRPQKPVVPQFVADWYEEHKDDFEIALFRCIDHIPSVYDEGDLNEFEEWIIDGETKPFQTLVNMHQFGYTVEKEPKYTVKCKSTKQYISNDELGPHFDPSFRSNFTKSDLEKLGLGWVFDCEGMEVEKVGK